MNTLILDTHLHLYPCFDLALAFNKFLDNTSVYGKQPLRVACLAERHDCDYFDALAKGQTKLKGFCIENSDGNVLNLRRDSDALELSLLPGRQVISREKIEILALGCTEAIDDGQPAIDVIYQIMQLGQVPVLPWSPGKWFGERGKLIEKLINELKPGDLLIGDTPLRPYGWPVPRLMKLAKNKGFTIVAGSDPLPFSGEEHWLGAYHSVVHSEEVCAANTILHELKDQQNTLACESSGKRTNPFSLLNRLRKNAASKKLRD